MDILHRFTGAVLYHSDLLSVREALIEAVGSSADLRSAYLRSANLGGADLSGADLRSADLRGADLRSADLRSAYLRSADLRDADLRGADLRGADLRSAYLRSANLSDADLRGADLGGATGINPLLCDDLRMLRDQGEVCAYKLVTADMRSPMAAGQGGTPITYAIGSEYECAADEDEQVQCSHGLSVASLAWCLRNWKSGWRILRVLHLGEDIAAIPIGTDGKWRVRRLKVIGELPIAEWGEGPWSAEAAK